MSSLKFTSTINVGDGFIACVGDGSIHIADGRAAEKILGGAHLESQRVSGWRHRAGGPDAPLGWLARRNAPTYGDDDNDRYRDGNCPSAGIGLFARRSWLDQPAHASRLYSGRYSAVFRNAAEKIARRTRDPHTPETDLPASGGAANRARRRKFLRQTSRSLMESSLDGIALDLWQAPKNTNWNANPTLTKP